MATGLPAEPEAMVKKAITYLENQRPWIGSYEHWRKLGYPVGSGMIERAVSLVINRRMKKRGMRWCRANATALVALRTDLLNDDWLTPEPLRAFPSISPTFLSEPIPQGLGETHVPATSPVQPPPGGTNHV
ncbi:MAG: hypothetical protein J2P37_07390 [Ktedonobacteraceae bacterium]|nr:hypothetical protein [Ktedonobacteraceae bacterium]